MIDYIESDSKKFLPSRSVVTSGKSVLDVGKNNRTMPRSNKEIKIANESIFKSFKVIDKKFTNYLPRKSDEYENDLLDLLENLSNKRPFNSVEEEQWEKWGMTEIYCEGKKVGGYDESEVKKRVRAILKQGMGKLKKPFRELNNIAVVKRRNVVSGKLKGFRLYITLRDDCYYIVLLDPLHFVMPSKKQKQEEYSFKTHQKNNKCMHDVIKSNEFVHKFYKQLTSK